MTLSASTAVDRYAAAESQTVFPYTFKILDASHLQVYEGDTEITTGFTVSGVGSDSGGNVTYTTAPRGTGEAALTVTLKRVLPFSQPDDLPTQGALNTDTLEEMIDKSRMIDQQLDEVDQRSLKVPVSSSLTGLDITPVANGYLTFNADADAIIAAVGEIGAASVSAFGATLVDDASADAARATLGIVGRRVNMNGDGRVAQIVLAATADDAYAWDGHYILTQTGTVTPSQLTDVADGLPHMMRLTQSQATAQRIGLATIIEGTDCKHLRGGNAVLSGKVRISNSQAIRYAILEWTGTEDAPTSDVVNDWTSGTYSAGNFFLGANLGVTAVGTITPAANTVTDLTELVGAISSSMNNAILLIWTEAVAAQNVTLDVRWQLEAGAAATPYEHRPLALELAHCKRYFERLAIEANEQLAVGTQVSTTRSTFPIRYEVEKRAAPTISITAADWDVWVDGATVKAVSSASADLINTHAFRFDATAHAAGGATGQAANLAADNAATRYIDISARL